MEGNDRKFDSEKNNTTDEMPDLQTPNAKENPTSQDRTAEQGPTGTTHRGIRNPHETDWDLENAIFPEDN